MLTVYGIKNCDSVIKARRWLENNGIEYQFHDFRQDGVDKNQLSSWVESQGWEKIVNKRSTSWRNLPETDKNISSNAQAINLLLANPTLIKRPVTVKGKKLLVGFKESEYNQL